MKKIDYYGIWGELKVNIDSLFLNHFNENEKASDKEIHYAKTIDIVSLIILQVNERLVLI